MQLDVDIKPTLRLPGMTSIWPESIYGLEFEYIWEYVGRYGPQPNKLRCHFLLPIQF